MIQARFVLVSVACLSGCKSASPSAPSSQSAASSASSTPSAASARPTSTAAPPPTDPIRDPTKAYFDAPAPPPGLACDKMSAPQCVHAAQCVLVPPPRGVAGQYKGGDYVCRDAQAPCEGGITQSDPRFKDDCAGRSNCVFRETSCFCFGETKVPSGISNKPECYCGGGPVQTCRPAPKTPCKLACSGGVLDYSCGDAPTSTLISEKCPDDKPKHVKAGFEGHTVECDLPCAGAAGGSCKDDTGATCSF